VSLLMRTLPYCAGGRRTGRLQTISNWVPRTGSVLPLIQENVFPASNRASTILRIRSFNRSTAATGRSPLKGSIDLFQMTELTVIERERDLGMTGAAILAGEDVLHIVFSCTLLGSEDLGMTEFASIDVGVYLV